MLIKTWFILISVILAGSLAILLYSFKIANPLHWMSLLVLIVTIILTVIVYLEQPKQKGADDVQKTYVAFLKQKDKQIEELQKKSDVLFKTAVKRSERDIELAELKKKLEAQLNQKD